MSEGVGLKSKATDLLQADWARQIIRFFLLWAVFVVLDIAISFSTRMDAAAFDTPVLLLAWAGNFSRFGIVVAIGLAVILLLPGTRRSWQQLDVPAPMRWASIVFALFGSWAFLTLSHNYYFDRSFMWDRLFLLICLIALWWRPGAIFGVTILCYLAMWQYSWPDLGGPVYAHKTIFFEIFTAVMAWLLLRALNVKLRAVDLIMLWGILIASRYWSAGYAKFSLNWWEYTNVHHALIASYAHGWLGWMQQETVVYLAELVRATEPWVEYGVLAFELAAIALFVHRKFAALVLLAAIVFHIAVVAVYGFIFWTWIAADLIFLALVFRWPDDPFKAMKLVPRLAVTSVLIAFAPFWNDSTLLGWFDSPLSYSFRYTVHDESGGRYSVSPRMFAPYDDIMTMSGFGYLSRNHAILTGPYGVVRDSSLARSLGEIDGPEAVDALQSGQPPPYIEASSNRMAHFLDRVFAVRNAGGARHDWIGWFAAPPQFLSYLGTGAYPAYDGSVKVTRVTVDLVTTWYKDQKIYEVRRDPVLDVAVGEVPPPHPWEGRIN